jgi:hypothetical protein
MEGFLRKWKKQRGEVTAGAGAGCLGAPAAWPKKGEGLLPGISQVNYPSKELMAAKPLPAEALTSAARSCHCVEPLPVGPPNSIRKRSDSVSSMFCRNDTINFAGSPMISHGAHIILYCKITRSPRKRLEVLN